MIPRLMSLLGFSPAQASQQSLKAQADVSGSAGNLGLRETGGRERDLIDRRREPPKPRTTSTLNGLVPAIPHKRDTGKQAKRGFFQRKRRLGEREGEEQRHGDDAEPQTPAAEEPEIV